MAESGYAVFIEPKGSLLDTIGAMKHLVAREQPASHYLSHPPHLTLIVGKYTPSANWVHQLQKAVASLGAFTLTTTGWHIFEQDALADGGDTITLRAESTSSIHLLQMAVANVLGEHQLTTTLSHPLASKEPFSTSLRRFGFPFIGQHWIPHFSIASVSHEGSQVLMKRVLSENAFHRFLVARVSVWQVAGDTHTKILDMPLGNS